MCTSINNACNKTCILGYHLMNLGKCVYPCDHHSSPDTGRFHQEVPSYSSLVDSIHPPGKKALFWFPSPSLNFTRPTIHINGIISPISFCIWLLFLQHNVFEIHFKFIFFFIWVVFHCRTIPLFIYLLVVSSLEL